MPADNAPSLIRSLTMPMLSKTQNQCSTFCLGEQVGTMLARRLMLGHSSRYPLQERRDFESLTRRLAPFSVNRPLHDVVELDQLDGDDMVFENDDHHWQ